MLVLRNDRLIDILEELKKERGVDFSGYRSSMLERRTQKRMFETNNNPDEYLKYLKETPSELDNLIDVFTINVSGFFRDPLIYEYIKKKILPQLFLKKKRKKENFIRIWSAGCALGEEPYSIAIMLNEFLKKEDLRMNISIIATDIDKKALLRAAEGNYGINSVRNVMYGILNEYFIKEGNKFKLNSEIIDMVQFSYYDLLDNNNSVPPDSIFGDFDLVFCRNVLIYFTKDSQERIFSKLHRSLNKNGFLILGNAEIPSGGFINRLSRENKLCKIYMKAKSE